MVSNKIPVLIGITDINSVNWPFILVHDFAASIFSANKNQYPR